jgi:hypothetical protein
VSISTSRKLVEPFNRLKNRANLFRRRNYSSQLNINSYSTDSRFTSHSEHIIPTNRPLLTNTTSQHADVIVLKRSNSMIYPQQRLQTLRNHCSTDQRNSLCVELTGCSTDESSTDDYQLNKSSLIHNWHRPICSTMNHIDEYETSLPSDPSMLVLEAHQEHDDNSMKENGRLI